jgi:hypothetical protein
MEFFMQNADDKLNNQDEVITISEGELYNKISDSFYDILSPLSPDERTNEIQLLLQEFQNTDSPDTEATTKPVLPGLKPKTYRAMKKTDLKFFEEIFKVGVVWYFAKAVAIFATLKPALVYGLGIFIYRYWNKGIALTQEQGIVLKVVTEAKYPGFTADHIAHWISSDETKVTKDEVITVLQSLKNICNSDGNLIPLVQETNGQWSAIDV